MTAMMAEMPWWADHQNLATLARYMVIEEGDDTENLIDMLDKPWHFDAEFAKAQAWAAERDG